MARKLKQTQIPWLGEIPEDWGVSCVKKVLKFYTGWTPPTGKQELFEGDNLWANISDIGEKILYDAKGRVSDKAVQDSNIKISKKGSLLFSFKLSIGQVSFCGADMYTNEAIATFAPSMLCNLNYLYYMAPICIVENAGVNIYGAKLMNQDLIANATIPLPPLPEQEQIAKFLDEKCAGIDELVKNTKEAIADLKEMKKSIITEAVTGKINLAPCGRGQDEVLGEGSKRKLKQTNIPWLGEIPEGWVVKRLSKMFDVRDGTHDSPKFHDNGVPLVTSKNISDGYLDFSDINYISHKDSVDINKRSKVDKGDILISMIGTVGESALVEQEVNFCIKNVGLIKPMNIDINTNFCFYILKSSNFRDYIDLKLGGSIQKFLSLGNLRDFQLPIPPLDEQEKIAKFLDEKCAAVDEVIAKKEEIIIKSLEFKKSLIYEYVTGKKELI